MGQGCLADRGFWRRGGSRKIVLFSADRPLPVALIKLFEALSLFRARLQGVLYGAGHFLLCGRDIDMRFCGDGGKNGGA